MFTYQDFMFGIYVKAGSIDLQVIVMTQLITTLSVTHECAASPPTDLWLLSGYEVWKKVKMFRKASKVYMAAVAKSYSRNIDCFSFWKWLKISASLVLFSDPPQKLIYKRQGGHQWWIQRRFHGTPLLKSCLRKYYAQTYYVHDVHTGAMHFSFTLAITHVCQLSNPS